MPVDYFSFLSIAVLKKQYQPHAILGPVTGDLNNDGHQDLLVLGADYPWQNPGPGNVPQQGAIFFGDGKGGFSEASNLQFPVDSLLTVHPRKVIISDINGDGRNDVFIACHGWDISPFPGEQNKLFLSTAQGSWQDASSQLPQLADFTHSAAIADIDLDGRPDILAGNGYGGQNKIAAYMLMNKDQGWIIARDSLPVSSGQIMDFNSGNMFPGTVLSDMNADGYPDLIITADASANYHTLTQTTILWNQQGWFDNNHKTILPASNKLSSHIDLDAAPIDFNKDGNLDLIVIGTQGQPFYDGWFVQLLENKGNNQYQDVTDQMLTPSDSMGGKYGSASQTSWPAWVKVIDFNQDGFLDFAVEYNGNSLRPETPLIWLNNGNGGFKTLKVSDFVNSGNEWQIGYGHIMQTEQGYSFITVQNLQGELKVTGLLATTPYRENQASPQSSSGNDQLFGNDSNNQFYASKGNDSISGGLGIDTVDYSLLISNGSLGRLKKDNGQWQINKGASEGTDLLQDIERLKISTQSIIALDIAAGENAGMAYRIYQAAFARTPDQGGLNYWLGQIDKGMDLVEVSARFIDSVEFRSNYGNNPGHRDYVAALYRNVLGREGEQAGMDYWTAELDQQSKSREQVLADFAESNENITLTGKVIGNGLELDVSI